MSARKKRKAKKRARRPSGTADKQPRRTAGPGAAIPSTAAQADDPLLRFSQVERDFSKKP